MSQTGLKQAGGIYNEARLTTDLTFTENSTDKAPPEIRSKSGLTTIFTTVGAGAIRLVASVPVRSAQKTKFKRFPEVFPREPFSLFPAYQFLCCQSHLQIKSFRAYPTADT